MKTRARFGWSLLLSLCSSFLSSAALAGGGWVGNNPALKAFRTAQVEESALLSRGQSRLSFGMGYVKNSVLSEGENGYEPRVSYEYGLSDRLNLVDLSVFEYALGTAGDTDHRFSLVAGLVEQGLGFSSYRGFEAGPGLGLLHQWSNGGWSWTNLVSASGVLCSRACLGLRNKRTALDYALVRWRSGLARQLDNNWSVAASSESYLGYGPDESEERQIWTGSVLVANPSLGVTRTIGEGGQLDLNVGFDIGKLAARSQRGVFVAFSQIW